MSGKSFRKCAICDRRSSSIPSVFFAALPLDPTRCQQWVQAIGQEDLVHLPIEKLHQLKFVCGIHFAEEDFNKNRNRLLKSAVPKLYLTHPPLPQEMFVDFPQKIGCQKSQFPIDLLTEVRPSSPHLYNKSDDVAQEITIEDSFYPPPKKFKTTDADPLEIIDESPTAKIESPDDSISTTIIQSRDDSISTENPDKLFLLSLVNDFGAIKEEHKLDLKADIINLIRKYKNMGQSKRFDKPMTP